MTTTVTTPTITQTTWPINAPTENVSACELAPGDVLVVPGYIVTVTAVHPFNLVSPIAKALPAQQWPALHITHGAGGFVRFPHETVTRLVRIR